MYQSRQLTQVARRRRNGWLVGLSLTLIALVLVTLGYAGYLFFREVPGPVSPPVSPAKSPADVPPEPVKVSKEGLPGPHPKASIVKPDTEMIYEYHYHLTGKTRRETGRPTPEMVGLTEDGLRRVYPQYEIREFSGTRVVLREEIAGMLDPGTLEEERRIYRTLKEKEGLIAVYAGRPGAGLNLLRSTSIKTSDLPRETREQLAKGLTVKGDEEVARYLEGFEE